MNVKIDLITFLALMTQEQSQNTYKMQKEGLKNEEELKNLFCSHSPLLQGGRKDR
jgi:hypothetical protein